MNQDYTKAKVSLLMPNLAGGGAERVMVTLANEFSKRIANVDLVIINDDDMHYVSELSTDVNLVNLKSGRAGRSILSIRNYLATNKPDVLLTTLGHISSAAAIALAISGNLPTKLFIREDLAPVKVSLGDPFLYVVSKFQKWAYKRADGIIALCQDMASEISNHYNIDTPIHTIYNPIKINEVKDRSSEPVSPELPWPGECKFVLGVGRLEKQKDFKTLFHAVAHVRKNRDLKLVILGEGSERSELLLEAKSLGIEDSLFMPGFVANPFAYMSASVAYVLSSQREGLPNALIQAQICETECIATRCPTGPREILEDGVYGTLVNIGDHKSIASAIVARLENRPTNSPSPNVLHERYHPESVAAKYLSVLLG